MTVCVGRLTQEFLHCVYENFRLFELRAMPAIGYLQEFLSGNSVRKSARKRRGRGGVERAGHHQSRVADAGEQWLKIKR